MAERSIRDFAASFDVSPIADAWAGANGFGLSEVEPDGSRHYVRGSGLLTGQMMCTVRQAGEHVRIEAYVHARLLARISAFFLIPADMCIEPGGFKGALPRKMCREAVDKLLAQLGQPPISAADNAGPALPPFEAAPLAPGVPVTPGAPPAPATPPTLDPAPPSLAYAATDARPLGVLVVAVAEVVTAVICLRVAGEYWSGFNWAAADDEMNQAALDLGMIAAYLAIVGGGVAVAWRLWTMRRDAWMAAIWVSVGVIAVTLVSGVLWELEPEGYLGIAVHAGILGYLNLTSVRSLFGRPPLGMLASQP